MSLELPTIYVFVPLKVIGPGLGAVISLIFLEIFSNRSTMHLF